MRIEIFKTLLYLSNLYWNKKFAWFDHKTLQFKINIKSSCVDFLKL